MVPKAVEFVESLPKTENGKVNRRLMLAEAGNKACTAE